MCQIPGYPIDRSKWFPSNEYRPLNTYIAVAHLDILISNKTKTSWWFQPIWKICASQIGSSPQRSGWKQKNFETRKFNSEYSPEKTNRAPIRKDWNFQPSCFSYVKLRGGVKHKIRTPRANPWNLSTGLLASLTLLPGNEPPHLSIQLPVPIGNSHQG